MKRTPQRTCIGCKTKKPKKDLVRLVRGPQCIPLVDSGQKLPGRGAYLCASKKCLVLAVKKGALERALRQDLASGDDVRRLLEESFEVRL